MRFQCPDCKGIVSVDDTEMGSTVQCGHCNKPVSVPASRTAPGSVIGDFIIIHEIGRGGMGIVYSAHQISLDRPAAVKILADSYAKNTEFVVGFIKEARAAAKLNHPNIVQAYAVGEEDGIFYFAMEHVDGETMKSILKREGVLSVEKALDITRQIAEALDYAWQEEKLVHRDIKPDNIMLTTNGRAKLADLGLAKVGNESGRAEGEEVMGTPQYISPEQLTGDALDNRTDIYCLGATFYHFLTGQFPYPDNGTSATEVARQHLEGTLVPPIKVNPKIPESVSRIVVKMMAKDPAQRYQSAGKLAEDLDAAKRGMQGAPIITAPKLHMPEKTASGSDAGSEAGKKPSSSQQPGSVNLSPSTPAASGPKTGAIKTMSVSLRRHTRTEAFKAIPFDSPEEVKRKKEKSAEKNTVKKEPSRIARPVKIIVVVLVILLLAAGGWFCYLRFVKHEDPMTKIAQARQNIEKKIEKMNEKPEPTPFMKAALPVVEMVRQSEGRDQNEIARQCYAFLQKQLAPGNEEETEIQKEILEFFANRDEQQLETVRVKKMEEYEAEQERKRLAAAEALRQRQERERREKEREVERKLQAEERAQRERKINEFKSQIADRERKMILDLVRYGEKQDADGLRKAFAQLISDMNETPRQFSYLARPLANRARVLQRTMESAWEWEKIFTDGDPALIDMQIEIQGNICKVTAVRKGTIYAKNLSGKEFTVQVKSMLGNRKFQLFTVKVAGRLKKNDSLPYYYFWMNEFYGAHQVAEFASPRGKYLYRRFVLEYLKHAKQDPEVRAGLEEKFRNVPEFLGPQTKKAPAKRTPAKKASAKKKK